MRNKLLHLKCKVLWTELGAIAARYIEHFAYVKYGKGKNQGLAIDFQILIFVRYTVERKLLYTIFPLPIQFIEIMVNYHALNYYLNRTSHQ